MFSQNRSKDTDFQLIIIRFLCYMIIKLWLELKDLSNQAKLR